MLVLGDIAVVVKDAKAAAKWWNEKLGFEVRDDMDHWVTVASPRDNVLLHLCSGWAAPESGNTGIGFFAADVAAEEKELRAKGVEFTTPTTTESWGTMAMFKDPDGNEFAILQVPPRGPARPPAREEGRPEGACAQRRGPQEGRPQGGAEEGREESGRQEGRREEEREAPGLSARPLFNVATESTMT